MAQVGLQELLVAGCHFGHLTRRWNPKMKKFIFMERNGIHIIDLKKTEACLKRACEEVARIVRSGEKVLFVGTKKQAKDIVRAEAERCGQFYVTERWLGGTLTNFVTIKKSAKRLKTLEKMVTDGTYDRLSKKEILALEREREKLLRAIGGIADMNRLPGALFVVDTKKEAIAVSEANRLNIPVIAIVDTNSDPDPIDFPIPANDDAFKSISLITRAIADAIVEAQEGAALVPPGPEEEAVPSEPAQPEENEAPDVADWEELSKE
ncbi:MAG: 30S ribosomal protein S2 [candidate division KSB1 bacterium]|nr:30S ribosomal protein S2 [candidate division KSB1 bacterium]MDZ7295673.1 30S ribosomal protein S2 [candidate division KSB1 bacterium]MDZ7336980.1 30S ribosomal protein S2 [candidate division KSB1 bacterium]MDZ7378560.1 30S ribosomal protein S2 [candidate division KSB1 bacterium]MDZ7386657.1 30S ribosomal protein S2 [candidate division KSB1 bacterium]